MKRNGGQPLGRRFLAALHGNTPCVQIIGRG